MACFVYIIQNDVNNKKYVGISSNPVSRLKQHGFGQGILAKAFRKYGTDCFSMWVVMEGSRDQCKQWETELIVELKTKVRESGYNIADGGGDPPRLCGINHPNWGKKRLPTTVEKIKTKRKLQVCRDTQRDNYSKTMTGNKRAKRYFDDATARTIWLDRQSLTTKQAEAKYGVPGEIIRCIWTGERYTFVQNDSQFNDNVDTSSWFSLPRVYESRRK